LAPQAITTQQLKDLAAAATEGDALALVEVTVNGASTGMEETCVMVRVVDKNDTIGIALKAAAALETDFGRIFEGKGNPLQVSFLRGGKIRSTTMASAALIPLRDLEGFKGNEEGESGNISILVCGGKSTEEIRKEARETWRQQSVDEKAIRPTRRQTTPIKKESSKAGKGVAFAEPSPPAKAMIAEVMEAARKSRASPGAGSSGMSQLGRYMAGVWNSSGQSGGAAASTSPQTSPGKRSRGAEDGAVGGIWATATPEQQRNMEQACREGNRGELTDIIEEIVKMDSL